MRTRIVYLAPSCQLAALSKTSNPPVPIPSTYRHRVDFQQDRGSVQGLGASQAPVGVGYRQGRRERILKVKKEQKATELWKWLFCGENIPCGSRSLPGGINSPDGKAAREGEGSSREQAGTCRVARRCPQGLPQAAGPSLPHQHQPQVPVTSLCMEGHGALGVCMGGALCP